MDFQKYIHAVGTGSKGNRDLSFQESKDMMTQILDKNIHNEKIAAFLLGWRLKPETIDEFRGVISACDTFITQTTVNDSIELGYPFDGKAKNPYIFPLVAKILKDSELNLVVIGDELQPSKDGITIKDICSKIELDSNIHYFDRAKFFQEFHSLTDVRMRLGLRTGFNTIEKLPNVANSDYAITGVFHKPYVKKYVEIFSPAHYGINYTKSWDTITLEDSLNQLNNPSDEYLKLAKLNAAVFLFITQKAKSIDDAFAMLNG